jgi:hypothetical protein
LVEALDRERLSFQTFRVFRQAAYLPDIDQPAQRHSDTDRPRQLQHDEFIFGDAGKRAEGNLKIQDPPIPSARIANPPKASMIAENLSWTPANENRSAVSLRRSSS